MKNSRLVFIVFVLFLSLYSTACKKEESVFETYQVLFEVVDENNKPLKDATVTLYYSENDFREDVNAVTSGITNSEGKAHFVLVPFVNSFYVSIEAGDRNNFYSDAELRLYELGSLEERKYIINTSIPSFLCGRNRKRWKLVEYSFNGTIYEGCQFNSIYEFNYYGLTKKFRGEACPNPGSADGSDRWIISTDGKSILSGSISNPVSKTIVELGRDQMILLYTEGFVTLQEIYVREQ